MPSNRIGRINEEIQRELADQLRRLKDPRVSQVGMVSITRVCFSLTDRLFFVFL